jgi:hypothetical protein
MTFHYLCYNAASFKFLENIPATSGGVTPEFNKEPRLAGWVIKKLLWYGPPGFSSRTLHKRRSGYQRHNFPRDVDDRIQSFVNRLARQKYKKRHNKKHVPLYKEAYKHYREEELLTISENVINIDSGIQDVERKLEKQQRYTRIWTYISILVSLLVGLLSLFL